MKILSLPHSSFRLCPIAILAVAAGFCCNSAFAADAIWTGSSGNWNTSTNPPWSTGNPPGTVGFTTNQDAATFNDNPTPVTTRTITLDANRNLKNIAFNQSTNDGGNRVAYTLSSGSLLLTDAGAITYNSTTTALGARVDITSPITLQGSAGATSSYTFISNKTGTNSRGLVITGTVTGATAKVSTLTLDGTSNSATFAQGNSVAGLVDGTSGGTLGITKTGTGIWLMGAANSYTGVTTVNNGVLQMAIANAIGGSSAVTVTGGSLSLVTFDQNIASLSLQGGAVSGSGGILTIAASNYDMQSGSVSAILGNNGTTGLNKTTPGTATLSGTNTYTGATTISGGTLSVSNAQAMGLGTSVLIGTGGTLDLLASPTSYNLSVSGNSTVSVTSGARTWGAATPTLSGSGTLNVALASGASLRMDGLNSLTSGSTITFGSSTGAFTFGGTANVGNSGVAFDLGNGGVVVRNSTNASTDKTVNLGSLTGGINTILEGGTGGTAAGVDDIWVVGALGTDTTFSGTIRDGQGTPTPHLTHLNKVGAGKLTTTGTNSYTGPTTVTGGTLLVNGIHSAGIGIYSLGASGKLGGTGSITAASLTASAGGMLSPGGDGMASTTFTFALTGGMNLSASSNNTGAYIFDLASLAASDKITLTAGTLDVGPLSGVDFTFNPIAGFGGGLTRYSTPPRRSAVQLILPRS